MDENENETIPDSALEDDALAAMDEALAEGDDEHEETPAVEAADEESNRSPSRKLSQKRRKPPRRMSKRKSAT